MNYHTTTTQNNIKNIFKCNWINFLSKYGHLVRDWTKISVDKMLNCGSGLGFLTYKCDCGNEQSVFFTCKTRICSSCSKPLADNWLIKIMSRIPSGISYFHLYFTIPKDLRPFFKRHRDALPVMSKVAAKALLETARDYLHGIPGIICFIHTFGADLIFKPHVHVILTKGVYDSNKGIFTCTKTAKDKKRMNEQFGIGENPNKERTFYIDMNIVKAKRTDYLPKYLKVRCYNNLGGEKLAEELIFLDKFMGGYTNQHGERSARYVRMIEHLTPENLISYLGRYLRRPTISQSNIVSFFKEMVTYRYKDKYEDNVKETTLKVSQFIARLIQHIPNKNARYVYYAGIFAPRCKKKYVTIINLRYPSFKRYIKIPKDYAERLMLRRGVDPFTCSRCGGVLHEYYLEIPGYRPKFFDTQ